MNNIFTRVSIRKYQDKPVEKEKIEAILRSAIPQKSESSRTGLMLPGFTM